jgi:hypothetical protein
MSWQNGAHSASTGSPWVGDHFGQPLGWRAMGESQRIFRYALLMALLDTLGTCMSLVKSLMSTGREKGGAAMGAEGLRGFHHPWDFFPSSIFVALPIVYRGTAPPHFMSQFPLKFGKEPTQNEPATLTKGKWPSFQFIYFEFANRAYSTTCPLWSFVLLQALGPLSFYRKALPSLSGASSSLICTLTSVWSAIPSIRSYVFHIFLKFLQVPSFFMAASRLCQCYLGPILTSFLLVILDDLWEVEEIQLATLNLNIPEVHMHPRRAATVSGR